MFCIQLTQKVGFAAITFVEGDPFKNDPVCRCSVILFQGNLPFRTIDNIVRNASGSTTFSILIPRLWQKQVLVDERMKIVPCVSEMDSNDAVLFFTDGAAVLTLHDGRFGACFDEAGLVDDTDGMLSDVFFGDVLLEFGSHLIVIPSLFGKEPLDGADGHTGLQGDGFAVFAREGRNETGEIDTEVVPRILIGNAGIKSPKQLAQSGTKNRKTGKSIGNPSFNINSFKITSYTCLMQMGITWTLRCRTRACWY